MFPSQFDKRLQSQMDNYKINVLMQQQNGHNIVKLVQTYTSNQSIYRHSRKGITRIGKIGASSVEKPIIKHTYESVTDENFNTSNYHTHRQKKEDYVNSLEERVKILEGQIQKANLKNIQLQRANIKQRPVGPQLIQSHYLTTCEDVENILKEKQVLYQTLQKMEEQMNFLKLNMGIQEKYIVKIQSQVDYYRKQQTKVENKQEIAIQTNTIEQRISKKHSDRAQNKIVLNEYIHVPHDKSQIKQNINGKQLSTGLNFKSQINNKTAREEKTIRLEKDYFTKQKQFEEKIHIYISSSKQKDHIISNLQEKIKHLTEQLQSSNKRGTQSQRLKQQYSLQKQQLDYLLDFLQKKQSKIKEMQESLNTRQNLQHPILEYQFKKDYQSQIEKIVLTYQNRIKSLDNSITLYQKQINQLKSQIKQFAVSNEKNTSTQQNNVNQLIYSHQQQIRKYKINESTFRKQIKDLEQTIIQKDLLLERYRNQLMTTSQLIETKSNVLIEVQRQNHILVQRLQSQKDITLKLIQQLQLEKHNISMKYQDSNTAIKDQCAYQLRKIQALYSQKMQIFKKDYDVLYEKYLKYKNIAILLQRKY